MGEALTHLFVDCVSIPKDEVAANEAGEESVEASLLPAVHLLLNQQQGLVQCNIFHEVRSVGLGRLKDCSYPAVPAASDDEYICPRLGGCRVTHSPRPNRMAMIKA